MQVYVDVSLPVIAENRSYPLEFAEAAPGLLPLLGQKPHVLVLSAPIDTYEIYNPGFLQHPSMQHFTVIGFNAYNRRYSLPRLVGSPQVKLPEWSMACKPQHVSSQSHHRAALMTQHLCHGTCMWQLTIDSVALIHKVSGVMLWGGAISPSTMLMHSSGSPVVAQRQAPG